MDLDAFTTPTNVERECFLPRPRATVLLAFDIVEKLRDMEAEIACDILNGLIAWFPEVQEYLVKNHIDILIEEE